MGMGSCVSQVCMITHGPLHMLAYHQWAGWFHSRLGPCTHDKARTQMFSPEGSIDAWADPCPAPLVLYRCKLLHMDSSGPTQPRLCCMSFFTVTTVPLKQTLSL